MSKSNAPDTRNKLESIKVPKFKKKKPVKKKSFKEIAREHTPETIRVKITPKKTKGQLFKELYGYSKSLKRAMRRAGLDVTAFSDSLNEYRAIRKKRKKLLKAKQRDKSALKKAQGSASRATSKVTKKKK